MMMMILLFAYLKNIKSFLTFWQVDARLLSVEKEKKMPYVDNRCVVVFLIARQRENKKEHV